MRYPFHGYGYDPTDILSAHKYLLFIPDYTYMNDMISLLQGHAIINEKLFIIGHNVEPLWNIND